MFKLADISKANFDDERRKKLGLKTGKQMFSEAHANMKKSEEAAQWRADVEPMLKAELIQHMVNRKEITVMLPINNPTEGIPGQGEDDDDGFYNMSKSSSITGFEEIMEVIPAGTKLQFHSWDKVLGQWIFKSENKEYAIYDKPLIMFQQKQLENPGFFGLLYNTNIRQIIENK